MATQIVPYILYDSFWSLLNTTARDFQNTTLIRMSPFIALPLLLGKRQASVMWSTRLPVIQPHHLSPCFCALSAPHLSTTLSDHVSFSSCFFLLRWFSTLSSLTTSGPSSQTLHPQPSSWFLQLSLHRTGNLFVAFVHIYLCNYLIHILSLTSLKVPERQNFCLLLLTMEFPKSSMIHGLYHYQLFI